MPFCPPVYFCKSVGTPGEGRLPPVGGTTGLWEMPRRRVRSAKSYGRSAEGQLLLVRVQLVCGGWLPGPSYISARREGGREVCACPGHSSRANGWGAPPQRGFATRAPLRPVPTLPDRRVLRSLERGLSPVRAERATPPFQRSVHKQIRPFVADV